MQMLRKKLGQEEPSLGQATRRAIGNGTTSHFVQTHDGRQGEPGLRPTGFFSPVGKAPPPPLYAMGARVMVAYNGKPRWYAAEISGINTNGTFNVRYLDGLKTENNVPPEFIREAEDPNELLRAQQIQAAAQEREDEEHVTELFRNRRHEIAKAFEAEDASSRRVLATPVFMNALRMSMPELAPDVLGRLEAKWSENGLVE